MASKAPQASPSTCSQTLARHPHLTMQTPSTAQIRTAIEVLKKLGERLNEHRAHSITQLPDTKFGDQCAARIESRSIEQATRIQTVSAQLEQWRDELQQERRQSVSHRV